jgi:NADPH2:quinone reductase
LGFTGGDIPTVKVNRLLLKNISVMGAGWGEYHNAHPGFVNQQWEELFPLLDSGALQAPEPTIYPIERAAEALGSLNDRTAVGKISLLIREQN